MFHQSVQCQVTVTVSTVISQYPEYCDICLSGNKRLGYRQESECAQPGSELCVYTIPTLLGMYTDLDILDVYTGPTNPRVYAAWMCRRVYTCLDLSSVHLTVSADIAKTDICVATKLT